MRALRLLIIIIKYEILGQCIILLLVLDILLVYDIWLPFRSEFSNSALLNIIFNFTVNLSLAQALLKLFHTIRIFISKCKMSSWWKVSIILDWRLLWLLFSMLLFSTLRKYSFILRRDRILPPITFAIVCILIHRVAIWVLQLWGWHILAFIFLIILPNLLVSLIFNLYFHLSL